MAGAQSLWSETRHIRVDYVGDRQVVVMMLAGFVVFLATVLFIIAGHYRTRHQAIHPEHEDVPPHAG